MDLSWLLLSLLVTVLCGHVALIWEARLVPLLGSPTELGYRSRVAAFGLPWKAALPLLTVVRPELLLPAELALVPPEVWSYCRLPAEQLALGLLQARIPRWQRWLWQRPSLSSATRLLNSPRLAELRQAYLENDLPFPSIVYEIDSSWREARVMEMVEIGCSRPGHHLLALSIFSLLLSNLKPLAHLLDPIIDRMLLSPWPELFFARSMRTLMAKKSVPARITKLMQDLQSGVNTEDVVCLDPARLNRLIPDPQRDRLGIAQILKVIRGGKIAADIKPLPSGSKIGRRLSAMARRQKLDPALALRLLGATAVHDPGLLEISQLAKLSLTDCLHLLHRSERLLRAYGQQTAFALDPAALHHQLVTKAILLEIERHLNAPRSPIPAMRFLARVGSQLELGQGSELVKRLRSINPAANAGSRQMLSALLQRYQDSRHPLLPPLRKIDH